MKSPTFMQRLFGFVLTATLCTELHAMMEADKFIGAWRLVSAQFRAQDGSLAPSPYGSEPQGILMYDAQGTMSAQPQSRPSAIGATIIQQLALANGKEAIKAVRTQSPQGGGVRHVPENPAADQWFGAVRIGSPEGH